MFTKWYRDHRILFHVAFWTIYYVLFSLLWVKGDNYKSSFYLEFILLPMRIFAVYFAIHFLIPKYLLQKKIRHFIIYYCIFIIIIGIIQQLFTFFFFEEQDNLDSFFNLRSIIKSTVLVNSTVFFISTIYILILFFKEKDKNTILLNANNILELKSNRRTYRVNPKDIIYIEGLGNYVNYFLKNNNKITVYQSLKDCLLSLGPKFIKVQKSYIINKDYIQSFNAESIETSHGQFIPIGKHLDLNKLRSI